MYKDWEGVLYTLEDLEEEYREYAREYYHYGNRLMSWETFINSFERV